MKILVVDDHPLFMDGLLQVLRQLAPATVAEQALNAEQALAILKADPGFQLILVDINMPGMGGLDLLSALVEYELWIPAVVISAQDDPRVVADAMNAGALGFIPKSFGATELLQALKMVLSGEVFLPEPLREQIERIRRSPARSEQGAKLGITSRQLRVLELLVKGYSNRKIALSLNLSEHTVKSHLKTLFAVLNADNRTECVQKAVKLGLVRQVSPAND
ncbi:MAG TPA: response regulator transcription factor [Gammaproteobacteria bacterium]|nr:response regulator transcription factor [Gammaproteobacteria bacterium]